MRHILSFTSRIAITFSHKYSRTYARTHVRTYARTHVRTYAHMHTNHAQARTHPGALTVLGSGRVMSARILERRRRLRGTCCRSSSLCLSFPPVDQRHANIRFRLAKMHILQNFRRDNFVVRVYQIPGYISLSKKYPFMPW